MVEKLLKVNEQPTKYVYKEVKRICSWCKAELGTVFGKFADNLPPETHTCCDNCLPKAMGEIE